jgi:hypothetical protein
VWRCVSKYQIFIFSEPCLVFVVLVVRARSQGSGSTAAIRFIVQPLFYKFPMSPPDVSTSYATREIQAARVGTEKRKSSREFCLNDDFHVTFRVLLHAANLRHGAAGFTSPPKEGVLRPGLYPLTWVLKASTHHLDHWSRSGLSLPRERPGTHCTGAWVSPRAGLGRCGTSRTTPDFEPHTVHFVACCYTDWATGPTKKCVACKNEFKNAGEIT